MRLTRLLALCVLILLPDIAAAVPVKVRWVATATFPDGTPGGAQGSLGEYDISLGNEVFLLPVSAGFSANYASFAASGSVDLFANTGVALVFTSPTTAKFARFNGTTGTITYGRPFETVRLVIRPALGSDQLLVFTGNDPSPFLTAPVRIELDFPEGPPIPPCTAVDAIDDAYTLINDGGTHALDVLQNEDCTDDAPLGILALADDLMPDRGGTAVSDGTEVFYTPAPGFTGFEEFTYTVEDAGLFGGVNTPSLDVDTARVSVEILEDLQPQATDDIVMTVPSMPKFIDVLENDAVGNAPAAIEIVSQPTHGSASLQGAQTIAYFPAPGFLGEDVFEYRVIDANGDMSTATVLVRVFFGSGTVLIDLSPRDPTNELKPDVDSSKIFRVAILSGGEFFDAPALIDPLSLKIGPRQANIYSDARSRDVDGDGDADLVVKFLTHQTGIACGDTTVMLTGRTYAGEPIFGSDFVVTIRCE